MLGSPLNVSKATSVYPSGSAASSTNPFDSAASSTNPFDSDDENETFKPSRGSQSEPKLRSHQMLSNNHYNPFDDYEENTAPSKYSNSLTFSARNKYKNDFFESGGMENQSVQELENHAVYKSEETTKTVNSCLKMAEEMKETATNTMVMLHHQGEQITRNHRTAADIDHDLSRGEKILGTLGGIFSKTWKPKKTRFIAGPEIIRDAFQRKDNDSKQKEKLGLSSAPRKQHSASWTQLPAPSTALQKVEVEKAKQDDALSDLSNMLNDLKDMAIDMGSEIERQNKALDPFCKDVDELNYRVKQANQRTRRLIRK